MNHWLEAEVGVEEGRGAHDVGDAFNGGVSSECVPNLEAGDGVDEG